MHPDTFDNETNALFQAIWLWGVRFARGIVYFLVAALLLWINTYGLQHGFAVALAIGTLGVGSVTARISMMAVGALLLMAIMPLPVLQSILAAV